MNWSKEKILELLKEVKDPEVPVLDIVELGVVRDVEFEDGNVRIVITPTYSGCPAMRAIEDEITATLLKNGIKNSSTRTIFSPPWTTDWMSDKTKNKLKEYGIAPPGKTTAELVDLNTTTTICPFCNSENTELKSEFGSTACKSLHYCKECDQPFEHFKCL
jgi:ring-1,2-phenylacetyl-CoA epoxidase subunit PaaD